MAKRTNENPAQMQSDLIEINAAFRRAAGRLRRIAATRDNASAKAGWLEAARVLEREAAKKRGSR